MRHSLSPKPHSEHLKSHHHARVYKSSPPNSLSATTTLNSQHNLTMGNPNNRAFGSPGAIPFFGTKPISNSPTAPKNIPDYYNVPLKGLVLKYAVRHSPPVMKEKTGDTEKAEGNREEQEVVTSTKIITRGGLENGQCKSVWREWSMCWQVGRSCSCSSNIKAARTRVAVFGVESS